MTRDIVTTAALVAILVAVAFCHSVYPEPRPQSPWELPQSVAMSEASTMPTTATTYRATIQQVVPRRHLIDLYRQQRVHQRDLLEVLTFLETHRGVTGGRGTQQQPGPPRP